MLNCAGCVFSVEGTGPYYLIPALYAVAATVPALLARTVFGRLLTAFAVTVVASASLVNLLDPRTEFFSGPTPAIMSLAGMIEAIAKVEHAGRGYADYWDASALTWRTKLALQVAPVLPASRGRPCSVRCPTTSARASTGREWAERSSCATARASSSTRPRL